MTKLALFNKLPARAAYIVRVLDALKKASPLKVGDIEKATKLTKTQALCTLEKLIEDQVICSYREKGIVLYALAENNTNPDQNTPT